MLRQIFTSKIFIVGLAILIVFNQDVGSDAVVLISIIIALMLSDIAILLEKIHQLLLLQSDHAVDQAIASLDKQKGEDST